MSFLPYILYYASSISFVLLVFWVLTDDLKPLHVCLMPLSWNAEESKIVQVPPSTHRGIKLSHPILKGILLPPFVLSFFFSDLHMPTTFYTQLHESCDRGCKVYPPFCVMKSNM